MGVPTLGVRVGLDEIRTYEFCSMLTIEEDQDVPEREKVPGEPRGRP